MLTKLLKHEFRATARIMGPLYLVLLAVALGFNFSARLMDSGNFVLNMLAALVVMAYVVAITAVFIVAFILMLQRFYKNLLGDEGYIMFTLPASVHQHVWSKLIVSAVWFIATGVVVFLSVFVAAFNVSFLTDLASVFPKLFQQMTAYYAVNGTVYQMDAAPYINSDGRTMVPIRFVAEVMGYDVQAISGANGLTESVIFTRR